MKESRCLRASIIDVLEELLACVVQHPSVVVLGRFWDNPRSGSWDVTEWLVPYLFAVLDSSGASSSSVIVCFFSSSCCHTVSLPLVLHESTIMQNAWRAMDNWLILPWVFLKSLRIFFFKKTISSSIYTHAVTEVKEECVKVNIKS